ncbi:arylamine N-acetyltransferase [Psychrobacter sp. APC 3426]|uniref:arylamine N-acetyltransferase family protein n=1 Tax=Psychrobacter sp. APC 3426 TaxID=3035177 RepID=UPI0025B52B2A|nr:arylamine N-acetyltransferase [Psychrobacter sp. APC 3426]MDN3397815.1 arylamine N-acetyltransferase [Psychrobacter sp. APC 3426]
MSDINYTHYLQQLGFTESEIDKPIKPNLDTLKRLQMAHLTQYPFQSVTTILDRPNDLEEASIYDKVVERRLGGYCYELNGLFLALLRHLGYEARIITGVVILDNQLERRNARTHMAIIVTIDRQNYLVDVGFGGLVPTEPLLFAYNQPTIEPSAQGKNAAQIQTTPHGRYKIIRDDSFDKQSENPILPHAKVNYERYILCCEVKSEWQMLYVFDLLPQIKMDMIVGNWYISTYPKSPFKSRLMVSRLDEQGVRHTLLNYKYRRHQLGQVSQTKELESVDELLLLLKEVFYMNIEEDITASERQHLQSFLESNFVDN